MKKILIDLDGDPILTGEDEVKASSLSWCLDSNNVGHIYEREDESFGSVKYQAIHDFEDGEYGLILSHYEEVESTKGTVVWKRMEHVYYISKKKVIIKDGLVDVDSVKETTAELLNRCGYWGIFIEALWEVDKIDLGDLDRTKFIRLVLGS